MKYGSKPTRESLSRIFKKEGGLVMLLTQMQNVQLTDLNGKKVSISDFRGKNTLIFMWASW
ncbi:AhpC/TSA family protein [Planomicrobium soli]|uniref:AhpC/TSA family protein n=1 Tax=Planomicrobium soli TaxID=1176648 RepID=A0A2P8H1W3_9BACL|nr:AhpC/TSA family protein [Planomicrobium soli]